MVSGIGCSSRISGYVDFHTLHTLHGRALAFATGLKLSRPELTVIVPMGDGDALAIGGNHFIHAARRNIDLMAIVMNNRTYGMTGGQFSPLTDSGSTASTAPFGNIDPPFDTVRLALAAGASFVARTTTWHARQMIDIFRQALRHKGFAVVEVMSQCPTYYGRRNKLGDAVRMMQAYKELAVPVGKGGGPTCAADGARSSEDGTAVTADGSFEIGVFACESRPEYCEEYGRLVERLRGERPAAGAAAEARP